MKPAFVLLMAMCLVIKVSAQIYTVTHVKGLVYNNGRLLKTGDKLKGTDYVSAEQKDAELNLLSRLGRERLKFEKGKLVKNTVSKTRSELYTLTIQDFIENYTATKVAATKGDFDFIDFFRDTTGNYPLRIMIMDQQYISLRTTLIKIYPDDQFFICFTYGDDTVANKISRVGDSLFFTAENIPPGFSPSDTGIHCLLKLSYKADNIRKEKYFPFPLFINMPGKMEIKNIIDAFLLNIDVYNGNKSLLKKDIYAEIFYDFGRFYPDTIDNMIENALGISPGEN